MTGTDQAWPLHDATASRAAEHAALASTPPQSLMARAGQSVARLAVALVPHARVVQVWCGPGNNGGDGLVAACHLQQAGLQVRVSLLADPATLPPDAAWALARAIDTGLAIHHGVQTVGADLHIDALLGLGTRRAPQGLVAEAIAVMNGQTSPVLAVDLPSGLHPDTGNLIGFEAVRARATLALLTLKPGCHTGRGRDWAGEVWFDNLQVDALAPTAWLNGPAEPGRARLHATHKGSHGDVAVCGGAPGMAGAALLAARAALAAGAGRVYCSLLDAAAARSDPERPECMFRDAGWLRDPALLSQTTVVCGCGGGSAIREPLPVLLSHAARLVLDADALNSIAGDVSLQGLLRARATRALPTVLTPHPLEAARLLGCDTAEVQCDRLAAAQSLANATAATVVLKGSGSIIAAPAGLPQVNATGNAALATAGTGDVLAGWMGGLWAQDPQGTPESIASAATWQHGRAADAHEAASRGAPLRGADLVEVLARRPWR